MGDNSTPKNSVHPPGKPIQSENSGESSYADDLPRLFDLNAQKLSSQPEKEAKKATFTDPLGQNGLNTEVEDQMEKS